MFRTMLWSTIGLAAAASGPVALYSTSNHWDFFKSNSAGNNAVVAGESENIASPTVSGTGDLPVEGVPVNRLAEVFRFDVSTGWVMQRWPRVSTGMSDLQLQGYRVPLMTGTEVTDLAGSLTYYFNAEQQVERITFRGATGDARELIELVTKRYRFTRRMTNNPGLFVYESVHAKHKRHSILQVRLAPVVKSSNPYRKFDVTLSIERNCEAASG